MKVLLINNDGGGFADYIEVADSITVTELFQQRINSGKSSDYLIASTVNLALRTKLSKKETGFPLLQPRSKELARTNASRLPNTFVW
jgi:hypothetical protein